MKETFRYYIDGKEVNTVTSASICFNAKDALVQSANIAIDNYSNDLANKEAQVYYELDGNRTLLGTFLTTTPTADHFKNYTSCSVDCYSTLIYLMKYKLESRYTCKQGTQVTNEVIRLLQPLKLKYTLDIELSTKTTSNDIDFEIGTPYIDVINELLKVINYTSLFPTREGNYKSIPYDTVQGTPIIIDEDDVRNVVLPTLKMTNDFFNADNVYIRYVDSPTGQLVSTYRNDNPNSPISTVNAPTSHNVKEMRDIADVSTLYEVAKRECIEDAGRIVCGILYTKFIEIWYNNLISLNLNGIKGHFTATGWNIECATGAIMEISIEKVVKL